MAVRRAQGKLPALRRNAFEPSFYTCTHSSHGLSRARRCTWHGPARTSTKLTSSAQPVERFQRVSSPGGMGVQKPVAMCATRGAPAVARRGQVARHLCAGAPETRGGRPLRGKSPANTSPLPAMTSADRALTAVFRSIQWSRSRAQNPLAHRPANAWVHNDYTRTLAPLPIWTRTGQACTHARW